MSNFLEKVKVIRNDKVGSEHFILTLESNLLKEGKNKPKEGQFYMLEVNDASKILKRPISLHAFNEEKGTLEFFCKIVGEGTELLSELAEGETLEVQGPLGRGFALDFLKGHVCIVGGGIGLAPFKSVLKKLNEKEEVSKITFVAAGRNAELKDLIANFGIDEMEKVHLEMCTDDGSLGFHGHAVAATKNYFDGKENPDTILSCGPTIMLDGIADFAKAENIPYQLSLEARMGCGVGSCVCCAIKTKNGMKRVCKDGPVFMGTELL